MVASVGKAATGQNAQGRPSLPGTVDARVQRILNPILLASQELPVEEGFRRRTARS